MPLIYIGGAFNVRKNGMRLGVLTRLGYMDFEGWFQTAGFRRLFSDGWFQMQTLTEWQTKTMHKAVA